MHALSSLKRSMAMAAMAVFGLVVGAASPALAQSATQAQKDWAAGVVDYIQLMRASGNKIEYVTAQIQTAAPEIGNNTAWVYALLYAGNYPPENIGDYFRQLGVFPQTYDEGPKTHIQVMWAAGLTGNDVYQGFSGTWCTPGRAYANNCLEKFNQLNTVAVNVQDLIAVNTYRNKRIPLNVVAAPGSSNPVADVCNRPETSWTPSCKAFALIPGSGVVSEVLLKGVSAVVGGVKKVFCFGFC